MTWGIKWNRFKAIEMDTKPLALEIIVEEVFCPDFHKDQKIIISIY